MKQRHNRQHAVEARHTQDVGCNAGKSMQYGRSVIVKHAFGITRRARRVTERRRRSLVEFGPFVVSRLGRQKRFVTDDIVE